MKAAEAKRKKEGPFSIEEVLAKEAQEISGHGQRTGGQVAQGFGRRARRHRQSRRSKLPKTPTPCRNQRRFRLCRTTRSHLMLVRYRMDGDQRTGDDIPDNEVQARKAFYRALNASTAPLCVAPAAAFAAPLSVSASFRLCHFDAHEALRGKAAAIARRNSPQYRPSPTANGRRAEHPRNAQVSALGCFHYLSTVSGGGYVGSWLSSWRSTQRFSTSHQRI